MEERRQCPFYQGVDSQYCHLTSARAMGSVSCTVTGGLDAQGNPLGCLSRAREDSKDIYVKISPGACTEEGFKRLGIKALRIRA